MRMLNTSLLTMFVMLAVVIGSADAGVILTENQEGSGVSWPEEVTWDTYTANYAGTGLGVSSSSRISQTYTPTVDTAGMVGTVHFRYNNTSLTTGEVYALQIYEVTDPNANPLDGGGNIGTKVLDVSFMLTVATTATYPVLSIQLTGSDQVTLTAGQSYAFDLVGLSTGSMGAYRRGGSDSDGQGFVNYVPINVSPRDVVMAYTVVPEPATLMLLAAGGLLAIRRRRH